MRYPDSGYGHEIMCSNLRSRLCLLLHFTLYTSIFTLYTSTFTTAIQQLSSILIGNRRSSRLVSRSSLREKRMAQALDSCLLTPIDESCRSRASWLQCTRSTRRPLLLSNGMHEQIRLRDGLRGPEGDRFERGEV